MTERPILFSTPMVQAILAGRKSVTRRVIKPQPVNAIALIRADNKPTGEFGMCMRAERVIDKHVRCPYGQPGDTLWVREAWQWARQQYCICPQGSEPSPCDDWSEGTGCRSNRAGVIYRVGSGMPARWRPSIHMPRWASRITLLVTETRVERLHAISETDAEAEGATPILVPPDGGSCPHIEGFRKLWNAINGAGSWDANPWVWVVKFASMKETKNG